jgi:hypothetical protein
LKEREAAEEKMISEVAGPEIDSILSEDKYQKSALQLANTIESVISML